MGQVQPWPKLLSSFPILKLAYIFWDTNRQEYTIENPFLRGQRLTVVLKTITASHVCQMPYPRQCPHLMARKTSSNVLKTYSTLASKCTRISQKRRRSITFTLWWEEMPWRSSKIWMSSQKPTWQTSSLFSRDDTSGTDQSQPRDANGSNLRLNPSNNDSRTFWKSTKN